MLGTSSRGRPGVLGAVLSALFALSTVQPVNADGVGILGAGTWLYKPVCAHSCRRLINMSPILCKEDINGTDSVDGEVTPPTPECWLKDAAYMRTLALCVERGCAKDGVYLSAIEDYWEGHLATGTVGDRSAAMQPIRSYGDALRLAHEDMEVIGMENMPTAVNGEPLNQTCLIDEDAWWVSYNGQMFFQENEFGHGRTSIAIAVTTCAIPILFSLLRFLPAHSLFASRTSIWLDQPFWGHRYRVPVAGNWGIMPTRGQALFIAYIILSNIFLAVFPYYILLPNYNAPSREKTLVLTIGDRTGVLSMADFVALFLFASRNNILLWVTNWSHSTFLLLHRWVAYTSIMQAVVHSVLMLVRYDLYSDVHASESKLAYWYWGIIATLAIVLMWPAALLPIRQRAYQLFLSTHQVLGALTLIATFLHIWYLFSYNWGYEIWVYIAGGIWFFDRLLRILRMASNGVSTATVTSVGTDSEYLRIEIEGVVAEGHAYLYFPTLSWKVWESHPFSVMSSFAGSSAPALAPVPIVQDGSEEAPGSTSIDIEKSVSARQVTKRTDSSSSSDGNAPLATRMPNSSSNSNSNSSSSSNGPVRPRMTLLLRPQAGMTGLLAARAAAAGGSLSLPVLVESSYDANPSVRKLDRCSSLLCIAGGVGITAVLPLARRFGGVRARLCWGVRGDDLVQAAEHELAQLSNKVSVETSAGVRLPIADILRAELLREDEVGDIGVAVCGPPGMADECRKVIGEVVATGNVKRGVVFIDEAFSW